MGIIDRLNDKNILIWGYGREGKSSKRFIDTYCKVKSVDIFEGKEKDIDFEKYDLVLKSPGIFMKEYNDKITSQTELFLEEFSNQVVGITGTKGKSTTSTLFYKVLSDNHDGQVILAGNIGYPCFDFYDEIKEDTIIVYELSCHQLNNIKYSPHISVFLNLYEDHLDYYGDMDTYFKTKLGITNNQNENDYIYVGPNVPSFETKAKVTVLSAPETTYDIALLGEHNQFNASVVATVCKERFNIPEEAIRESMKSFKGLSHRLEYVGKVNGVDFYDDSISTIPQATIRAIESVNNAKTVIVGGMDRNIDYSILIDYIKNKDMYNFILCYESGKRIYKDVEDLSYTYYVEDLYKAVDLAKEITSEGYSCILSPAAASYGYFKDFEERGDVYKSYVLNNQSTTLLFTGDIGFDKYMDKRWEDENFLSKDIKDYFSDADHVIVNVEGPLCNLDDGSTKDGVMQLRHSMSPEVVPFLNGLGADIWNICNNHIMDAGQEGLKETIKLAKDNNVEVLGAGVNIDEAKKPVIINEAGGIGLIGVGYQRACRKATEEIGGCLSWSDMDIIKEEIKKVKESNRWCIIVCHGGEEFTALPSPYTRDRFLEYLNMGADIVVCHHPHVPMNYELVGDKAIFYSLGNFIFDTDYQRSQFNTDVGILLKLKFTEDSYEFDAMGIKIVRGKEVIEKGELPDIFEDIGEEEYNLLMPLSVKMFIEATKRQLKYLKPEEFKDADEEKFMENFKEPLRSGRVPGEVLDFYLLLEWAKLADKEEWKKSKHKKVIDFILKQM